MNNILVAIEFDQNAHLLINKSREISRMFKSKIWLLHVATPDPDFVGYEVGPQYIRDFRAKELRDEHRLLQEYSKKLKEDKIESEALLMQGGTIELLLEESEKLQIDLIISGHHQHQKIKHLLSGSVARQLLEKSKIPMLIIPLE